MTTTADRYRTLADRFRELASQVPDTAWGAPSPCPQWTARDVVAHVVGVHGMMLRPLQRELSPAPSVEVDPVGALSAAMADVQTVLDDPALAGTEYDGYFGRTSVGATIDRFLCFDLVVHGWDLAKAAGLHPDLPADEVERVRADAELLDGTMRAPNVIGPAITPPDGASAQDRLLAYLGRDPAWRP